jgi:hypothetical protein
MLPHSAASQHWMDVSHTGLYKEASMEYKYGIKNRPRLLNMKDSDIVICDRCKSQVKVKDAYQPDIRIYCPTCTCEMYGQYEHTNKEANNGKPTNKTGKVQ